MLSFVIPAYNEEAHIGQCLRTVLASAGAAGEPYEVIVVDDASTDRTAEIARSFGATIVPVHLRKISAVRNAGARATRGDVLIFVDADTLLPANTLIAALAAIRDGAVGGGARLQMDQKAPLWGRALAGLIAGTMRQFDLACGCFMFARRDAFEAVGGYDEQYYASEEIHLSMALKKQGRFVMLPEPVITSSRKFQMYSGREFLQQFLDLAAGGLDAFKRRDMLDIWYDGRREHTQSGEHMTKHQAGGT
ncbi:MAG TPA: glycosyltransferase [Gammaproteobacteria bacterium]|nr:glycosyltransferase [Gammaproteobacteria bacterium]